MPVRVRPLSPHLDIYRWQISNTLSILHRVTGVGLAVGLIALAYWLCSLAAGEESYETARRGFSSVIGWVFLVGWIFSFHFHLLNGMRHLLWDAGYGYERTQRHASGWFAVLGAAVLTLAVCLLLWRGAHA